MKETIIGIVIGIAMSIGILTIGVGAAYPNERAPYENMMAENRMSSHRGMMSLGNEDHQCPMMNRIGHIGMNSMMGMTTEEMDADDDGICDLCDMPVEACTGMMKGMEKMHNGKGHCSMMDRGEEQ
ncbi:MAG: ABC transporter permease [Candidatus Aenigmarchaeota archaeon]|nr:ABC transporter permease [Candidatus Aenigmarchaeota archaeon]